MIADFHASRGHHLAVGVDEMSRGSFKNVSAVRGESHKLRLHVFVEMGPEKHSRKSTIADGYFISDSNLRYARGSSVAEGDLGVGGEAGGLGGLHVEAFGSERHVHDVTLELSPIARP